MSAVPLQISPASSSGDEVSVQDLLDSLVTDTVLRSSDSCEIRVPKHYVAKFSPVLGALIQGASNLTVPGPTNAEAPLPVVQLPEKGATLIGLLSFLFPISPALPPTSAVEATMELLSAAQKYGMSSVLAHIRLCLAQQEPPFIHKDNAFRIYSLAQKYGLREEAVKAAQLTLGFFLTFSDLEGRLDIMPGAHLHELWTFHERVQTYISSDVRGFFKISSTSSVLKGLKCVSIGLHGIPNWLSHYVTSICSLLFLHNFVNFQNAWVVHVRDCGCVLPEMVSTIWTAIDTVVRDGMKKAELGLSILGGQTHSRAHIGFPTTSLPLSERVDVSQADVIIRSSDHVDFRVHKSILASSSPVFKDMFSLPQPPNNETVDGLPMVQLSEDAELVRALITALYPIPSEMPASYDRILALLAAAQKYDMGTVQSSIRAEVSHRKLSTLNGTKAFHTYAIASSWRLIPEMEMAARLSLDLPMTFEHLGVELREFEGWALRTLVNYRMLYRENLISCFKSLLATSTGPSKIWIACPGPKQSFCSPIPIFRIGSRFLRLLLHEEYVYSPETLDPLAPRINMFGKDAPRVPAWLYNVFRKEIGGPMMALEIPLVGPSDIRAKYLSALREHVTTDKCAFCMEVHVMEGDKYIVELELALTQAREKTTLDVS